MGDGTKVSDVQRWSLRRPLLTWFTALAVSAALVALAFWLTGIGSAFVFLPCAFVLIIWATALVISGSVDAWRQRQSLGRAALAGLTPPLVIGLGALAFIPLSRGVSVATTYAALAVNFASYERIIGAAQIGAIPPNLSGRARQFAPDGTEFEYERTSPHRIAFALPGGFINEWDAILYDPEEQKGVVENPSEPIRGEGAPDPLFDHWWTIESCTQMVGKFYRCHFS